MLKKIIVIILFLMGILAILAGINIEVTVLEYLNGIAIIAMIFGLILIFNNFILTGIIILVVGAIEQLEYTFGEFINIYYLLIGLALIAFALKVITYRSPTRGFKKNNILKTQSGTYTVPVLKDDIYLGNSFGTLSVDLSTIEKLEKNIKIKTNTNFGKLKLIVKKEHIKKIKKTNEFSFFNINLGKIKSDKSSVGLIIDAKGLFSIVEIEEKMIENEENFRNNETKQIQNSNEKIVDSQNEQKITEQSNLNNQSNDLNQTQSVQTPVINGAVVTEENSNKIN